VTLGFAVGDTSESAPARATSASLSHAARSFGLALCGVAVLLAVWWLGGRIVASNPATANFAGFAPMPTFERL